MQSKQINSNDARSFVEIWETLTPLQRDNISLNIYRTGCCKSRITVWKWAHGTYPDSPLVRNAVARIVTKALGSKVTSKTLFPDK